MRTGHVHELPVTGQGGGHREQLQVHHIVHDDDEIPLFPGLRIPGAGAADRRAETRGQGVAGIDDHLPVIVPARQAPAVAVAAVDHESDIVVVPVVLLRSHSLRHPSGGIQDGRIARIFIEIPQGAGEKARHPVFGVTGLQDSVFHRIDQAAVQVLDGLIHPHRLQDGEVHLLLDELRHLLLRSSRLEREEAAQAAQRRQNRPSHYLPGCCWERSSILMFS